jgi:hypothetical protein
MAEIIPKLSGCPFREEESKFWHPDKNGKCIVVWLSSGGREGGLIL